MEILKEDKNDTSNESNESYEYFNETAIDKDFTLPKTDSKDTSVVTQKSN